MIIDGKKVRLEQTKDEQRSYYYSMIKIEVKSHLMKLSIVRRVDFRPSKSSDSMYFYVYLKHGFRVCVSIRTHEPIAIKRRYCYFLVNEFEDLPSMLYQVSLEVTQYYNTQATANNLATVDEPFMPTDVQLKLGIKPVVSHIKGKPRPKSRRHNRRPTPFGVKGSEVEMRNRTEESYKRLLEEFKQPQPSSALFSLAVD